MSKTTSSILALSLITLCVLPGDLSAGHFGLFKRHRSKPKCCPVTDVCQPSPAGTVVVAAAPLLEVPTKTTVYRCQGFCEGYDEDGNDCMQPGELITGTDCELVHALAEESAARACEDNGCYQSAIDVLCYPSCPDEYSYTISAQITGGCWYKATHKICCCNGAVIEMTATSKRADFAKRKAKIFACNLAAIQCDGRIRWCSSQICPVAAPAQTPCCQ